MIFHKNNSKSEILESAAVSIQTGIITSILTDVIELVDAPESYFTNKPKNVKFIHIDNVNFSNMKSALTTAVYLENFNNIETALKKFQKVGLERFPHLHLSIDYTNKDVIEIISKIASISSYYELSVKDLGITHIDSYSEYSASIIVPVYGVENYIKKCAESLRDQNFKGTYEVIFVDDGGKDKSVEIINEVIKEHPNLRVISKENGGAASARNFGIAQAKGQYIAFVDGDDYVSNDYVDTLFRAAILNNADISQAGFCHVNASTGDVSEHFEWFSTHDGLFSPVSSPSFKMMLQTPGIWRRMDNRKLLSKHETEFNADFRRHDDLPFNIEVLSNANYIAIARNPVYFYLLGRDGQDVGATDQRLYIHFRLFDYTMDRIIKHYWNNAYFKTYLTTMYSHHLWAYDRIDDKYKPEYLRGVAQQVFSSPGPFGKWRRLKVLGRNLKNRKKILLKTFLISFLKKTPLPSDI